MVSTEKEATLAEVVSALEQVSKNLKEVAKWVRFQNVPRLREVLIRELDTPQKKVAFDLTDGEHSRRDIAKEITIDDATVQGWWDKWFQLAIVGESETYRGRPQKIVSLGELGIDVPKLKLKATPQPPQPPAAPADPNAGGDHP